MNQALNSIQALILGLFAAIMAAMAAIEGFLRSLMAQAGVGGQLQKGVLIVVLVLLVLAALRVFGRVFGVLITIFLVLLLIHVLAPGLSAPGRLHG